MSKTTRVSEIRNQEFDDFYTMDYRHPTTFPVGVMKDGYNYIYEVREVDGKPTYNVEMRAAQGWELVKREDDTRHVLDPLNRDPLASQYWVYNDVIAMCRPKHYSDREAEYYHKISNNKLMSLKGVETDHNPFSRSASMF